MYFKMVNLFKALLNIKAIKLTLNITKANKIRIITKFGFTN